MREGAGPETDWHKVMQVWCGRGPVSSADRPYADFLRRAIPEYGPDLPSEAAFLVGQFNAKRIGLSRYVLLLRPMKA